MNDPDCRNEKKNLGNALFVSAIPYCERKCNRDPPWLKNQLFIPVCGFHPIPEPEVKRGPFPRRRLDFQKGIEPDVPVTIGGGLNAECVLDLSEVCQGEWRMPTVLAAIAFISLGTLNRSRHLSDSRFRPLKAFRLFQGPVQNCLCRAWMPIRFGLTFCHLEHRYFHRIHSERETGF